MKKAVKHQLSEFRKLGIPFALRTKMARANNLNHWLYQNFPDGGIERGCLDERCSCSDMFVYEGDYVIRRNRIRDGQKVKTERTKRVRFTLKGSVLIDFGYLS
jgi:hypothetical protein